MWNSTDIELLNKKIMMIIIYIRQRHSRWIRFINQLIEQTI